MLLFLVLCDYVSELGMIVLNLMVEMCCFVGWLFFNRLICLLLLDINTFLLTNYQTWELIATGLWSLILLLLRYHLVTGLTQIIFEMLNCTTLKMLVLHQKLRMLLHLVCCLRHILVDRITQFLVLLWFNQVMLVITMYFGYLPLLKLEVLYHSIIFNHVLIIMRALHSLLLFHIICDLTITSIWYNDIFVFVGIVICANVYRLYIHCLELIFTV